MLVMVGAVAACSGGGTDIISPPPPPPTGLTLAFLPDADDVPTAAALGWQAGIPGLAVTLTPRDSSRAPRSFTSSSQGALAIADLEAGDYVLEAGRWLTNAERAKLAHGDDAAGFATRLDVRVAGSGTQNLTVPASRRRALVISEWAFNALTAAGLGAYYFGGYLKLTNNADTTVYLDGVVIGEGFAVYADFPLSPCAENAPYAQDSEGIWTRFFQQIPGSGRDHPLPAGQSVTIATDAIDHRPIFPRGPDLRGADFEFSGISDADNPDVPNMLDVGIQSHSDGHGLYFQGNASVLVIAMPVAVAGLTVRHFAEASYARLPRDHILDVLWVRSNYLDSPYAECPRLVGELFDRAGSLARGTDEAAEGSFSLSRRSVPGPPASVLQHTRSSAADFVRTRRSLAPE